ncbi:MAG: hypothetical protein QXW44_04735, partial [Pyrobaculum sp.]
MSFYLVLPPGCPADFKTPKFSFRILRDPLDVVFAAECKSSPIIHVPGVARYVLSTDLTVRKIYKLPEAGWFTTIGGVPWRYVTKGKLTQSGENRLYGKISKIDVLRFQER